MFKRLPTADSFPKNLRAILAGIKSWFGSLSTSAEPSSILKLNTFGKEGETEIIVS